MEKKSGIAKSTVMRKKNKVYRNHDRIDVIITMDFGDFQELRSFMNVIRSRDEWEMFNRVFLDVPKKFQELLKEI